jgi:hypothetical protein
MMALDELTGVIGGPRVRLARGKQSSRSPVNTREYHYLLMVIADTEPQVTERTHLDEPTATPDQTLAEAIARLTARLEELERRHAEPEAEPAPPTFAERYARALHASQSKWINPDGSDAA